MSVPTNEISVEKGEFNLNGSSGRHDSGRMVTIKGLDSRGPPSSSLLTFRTLDSPSWRTAFNAKHQKYYSMYLYLDDSSLVNPFPPILPGDWRLVDARLINSKLGQLSFALKPENS